MAQENEQLVALLKKYVDVFTWTYDEIPSLDPRLVVHSLNVDLGVKLIQPARVFHTNVEAQITQEAVGNCFYQAHLAPQVAFQHKTREEKEWANLVLCGLL